MEKITSKKERLLYLDVAKFIGILLVIYAHTRENGIEVMYIYSFHMPLFFLINGVTFKIKDGETSGEFLIRKIKSYLLPFLVLSLILVLNDLIFDASTGRGVDWAYFINKLIYVYQDSRPYPLWFVLALFFADLMMYVFIKLSFKKDYLTLLYASLALAFGIIFYEYTPHRLAHALDPAFIGVFFICLGYLFARPFNSIVRDFLLKRRLLSLVLGLVLLSGCFLLVYVLRLQEPSSRARLEMWGGYYKPFYIRIPGAVLGAFGVLFISNAIANKPVSYLGRHTLVVLAFQQNLTIRLFRDHVAKSWYQSIRPLSEGNIQAVYFSLVCTIFSIAILIPLSIVLFETHASYLFFKKPAPWYTNLLSKIHPNKKDNQESTATE